MEKSKKYERVKFTPEVIRKAVIELEKYVPEENRKEDLFPRSLQVRRGNETWEHDTESEFFADYRQDDVDLSQYRVSFRDLSDVYIVFYGDHSEVSVTAKERHIIESVFMIFEESAPSCLIPETIEPPLESKVRIFIGHGQKETWRDLKDHLQDKQGFIVNAYEIEPRAGHDIGSILKKMLIDSSFAILVFTGENVDSEGRVHVRENVIHELGLFQGKLGFRRTVILLEEGVEKFSNMGGIQYISFPKDNIKITFGEVVASIRREFGMT